MKSAMELYEMGKENAIRIAEEREARKREKHEKRNANSIQWCESVVSPALEKMAKNGQTNFAFEVLLLSENDGAMKQAKVKAEKERSYVDRKKVELESVSEELDIECLQNYLANYGYKIVRVGEYPYWFYGLGMRDNCGKWRIEPIFKNKEK